MYPLSKPAGSARCCRFLLLLPLLLAGCGGGSSGTAPATSTVQTNTSNPTPVTVPATTATAAEPPAVATANQSGSQENPVRLLVLYADSSRDIYPDPELRITHLVNIANQIAASSGVALDLELVHIAAVSYPDDYSMVEALEALTFNLDPAFASIPALREAHAADLVTLFRPYANDGLCGYAWVGGQNTAGDFSGPNLADYGFSTVAINCSDYTLLHEIGHNLGLAHSRRENPDGGSLPHGVGYGVDNGFVTIMANASEFNAIKLPQLSNPEALCQGEPCGVDRSDPVAGADAVDALGMVRDQVAAYR